MKHQSEVAGAEMTPLERQQLHVSDAAAHTFWHWVRFGLVADAAERHGATRVVDIGAGSGMLGDWLGRHHPEYDYSFDELSVPLDEALAARFGDDARHDPGDRIGRGDVATMLDVIEHIDDDAAALAQVHERMDPGATLVVTVPALQWAFSSWDTALGHHRRYSKRQLVRTLSAAGFRVEGSGYLFPEMLPLLPIRKLRRAPRDTVDFPSLSPLINRIGHVVSSATARGRRIWPAGTSVIAVATKPPTDV